MKIQRMLLFSVAGVVTGQGVDVPLKNWAAPLYWQPSQSEAGRMHEIRRPLPEAATPAGSLVFVAMTPCRVVDTRAGQMFPSPFGTPSLVSGGTRSFPIQSSTMCTIPPSAMAYSFNVTLVPPAGVGYLKIWPTGVAEPNAVTVDDITGDIRNNAAIVPAGTPNGSVDVKVNAATDLVIDINGYYAPSTGITLAQGTASAPSLSFSGDAGTGIFSSGASTLNFATGGTNRFSVRSDGDLDLGGNIRKGGILFLHNLGTGNLGVGLTALANNTTGGSNTAAGSGALAGNTTGGANTANGTNALNSNTTGANNTATGFLALNANQTGSVNTANGAQALGSNTTGGANTASGFQALGTNTTGGGNTASGFGALNSNSTASYNTANGYSALTANGTGSYNTASGYQALANNTAGGNNTAVGGQALLNATGGSNTALGFNAGVSLTTGNNNVYIVNPGASTESGVIRIGTSSTHTALFAAGIYGVAVNSASSVMIDSNGQLGTVPSSRRYKDNVQDMAEASNGVLRLRPVTFQYKRPYADGSRPIDYGLIAEEVAEVYPDLVVKGKDGEVDTVQYHKLIPMLLNELQKLRSEVTELRKTSVGGVQESGRASSSIQHP